MQFDCNLKNEPTFPPISLHEDRTQMAVPAMKKLTLSLTILINLMRDIGGHLCLLAFITITN